MKPWLALPLVATLAACATAPKAWTRPDGKAPSPEQVALDETACHGEQQRAQLSGNFKTGLAGVERYNQGVDVYVGCMASHGYAAAHE